jgi:cell division protein FtsQ
VQPLGPGRGRARGRSQEALLARGIATARDRGLPAVAQRRSIIVRAPRSVRLGGLRRDRLRGKWLIVSVVFLATALGYGAVLGGQTARMWNAITDGAVRLAVAAGFGVERITVEGRRHTTDSDITAALQAGPNTILVGFDTDAAKARLEAVPWIRHAQIMRLLPSTLQVVIEEREPFAIWQSQGKTYVVDAEGAVLAPALREAYQHLPFVVGEGAAKNARELIAALEPFDGLKAKTVAAVRVGDRRWNLKLVSGLEIMLPDDAIDEALKSFTKLDERRNVLNRDIAAVDLRLLDRITVRLREDGTAMPHDANAPAETPTASTKTATPKGRT